MPPKRAAGGKKKKKIIEQTVSWIWKVAATIAVCGAIVNIVASSTTSWFSIEEMTIHYKTSSTTSLTNKYRTQLYGKSSYGLYLVYFNNGADVGPWYNRVSYTCSGYNALANDQAVNGLINIYDSSCSTNCVGHFKTRCSAYKSLATIGLVEMAFLIGSSCAAITGAVWLFVFGKSQRFLQFAWLASGAFTLAGTSYYLFLIKLYRDQLNATAFFPPWIIGYSVGMAFAGGSLLVFAGLLVALAAMYDRRQERKAKEQAIIEKEAAGVLFEMPGATPAGGAMGIRAPGLNQPGMMALGQSPFQPPGQSPQAPFARGAGAGRYPRYSLYH